MFPGQRRTPRLSALVVGRVSNFTSPKRKAITSRPAPASRGQSAISFPGRDVPGGGGGAGRGEQQHADQYCRCASCCQPQRRGVPVTGPRVGAGRAVWLARYAAADGGRGSMSRSVSPVALVPGPRGTRIGRTQRVRDCHLTPVHTGGPEAAVQYRRCALALGSAYHAGAAGEPDSSPVMPQAIAAATGRRRSVGGQTSALALWPQLGSSRSPDAMNPPGHSRWCRSPGCLTHGLACMCRTCSGDSAEKSLAPKAVVGSPFVVTAGAAGSGYCGAGRRIPFPAGPRIH